MDAGFSSASGFMEKSVSPRVTETTTTPHVPPRVRERRIDPSELLDRQAHRQEVGARAPVLLRIGKAEEAQLPHLLDRIDGKYAFLIPTLRIRPDGVIDELANDLLKLLLFRGEI